MSNQGNRHPNQLHHRDQSDSHSRDSSSGTEVPQASGNDLHASTWNMGLSGRERDELLMQDYIINHPELALDYSQELDLFLQSNFQDRLLDHEPSSEKTPSSSRYQNIIDHEDEKRAKEQISPINKIPTEADDDQIDPFEQFEEKTIKNCPPPRNDPQKEGKYENRTSPFEMATQKQEPYAGQLSKVKIIKQWVIDRRILSRNIEKKEQLSPYQRQREEQKNPCYPLHPKIKFRRTLPIDLAIKQYQKHVNPSLENWQSANDLKVNFNRVICLKEFDPDSSPLDIGNQIQKYEVLQLPPNPSHSLEVVEKSTKVKVIEMIEQVKQTFQKRSIVDPLIDVDQQFVSAFPEEEDIVFVISDQDNNESSPSDLSEFPDK